MSARPNESRVARDSAAGGYRPEMLRAMWESVPAGMRLTCFRPDTVPNEYRGGLGEKRGRSTALDLSERAKSFLWSGFATYFVCAALSRAFLGQLPNRFPW